MRAAVLDEHGFAIRDWPAPTPGAGDVLVALTKVGICGSDAHLAVDGSARPTRMPIVLGHEPAGRIAALGQGVTQPAVGTRVVVAPIVSCGVCDLCQRGRTVLCRTGQILGVDRDGALADFVVVPECNVLPIPPPLDDTTAAVATDAVATAYHAVVGRGGVGRDSRVAVWGVGGLGLPAVAIAKYLGARHILAIDTRPGALARATEAGADEAVGPDEGLTHARRQGGVDVALEFVGRPETVSAAARSLDRGGRAVIVGVGYGEVSAGRIITFVPQERELVASWGSEPEDIETALRLLASGDLRIPGLVGAHIGLDEVPERLVELAAGTSTGSRTVVDLGR
jgi:threonine dehydrogenase-like Zn-dependent dehydrogenase